MRKTDVAATNSDDVSRNAVIAPANAAAGCLLFPDCGAYQPACRRSRVAAVTMILSALLLYLRTRAWRAFCRRRQRSAKGGGGFILTSMADDDDDVIMSIANGK